MAALLVVIIVFGISLLGAGDENAGIGKALGNIGDKLEATATP